MRVSPAAVTLPGNGPNQKSIWRFVILIAVLALVIGTTLGDLFHHHDASNSPESCPICHLSHQAVESAVPSVRVEILVPEGRALEPQEAAPIPSLVTPQIPVRAPPA
jgi:hypothetical protein